MKIVPAINAETIEEILEKIERVKSETNIVHIDVADGSYTPNVLWHQAEDLEKFGEGVDLELHLMLSDIDSRIDSWLTPKVKKIIFQIDASLNPKPLIEKIKSKGIKVGIATKPGISWTKVAHYKGLVDYFLFLLVTPGQAGQVIDLNSLDEVREMRRFCDSCIIEVDGGMNRETIPLALEAGANIIISASAIFNKESPEQAFRELGKIVK